MSNLHLIKWNTIIIDTFDCGTIRKGTVRGNALATLESMNRIALLNQNETESQMSNNEITKNNRNSRNSIVSKKRSNSNSNPDSISKYNCVGTPNDIHKHRISTLSDIDSEEEEFESDLRLISHKNVSKQTNKTINNSTNNSSLSSNIQKLLLTVASVLDLKPLTSTNDITLNLT